jgi:hypothetical protein
LKISRAVITFSLIDPEEWREAYAWHREFVSTNDLVFPRTMEEYERLAADGQIWCARDDGKKFLGLAYFKLGMSECRKLPAWEIGGLMVHESARKRGVGSAVVCLTLGHVLFEHDPMMREQLVVAHVHAENKPGPRPIFQNLLQFAHECDVKIPEKLLPGLRAKDGFVVGDEFILSKPATLKSLATWCRAWSGKLKDGEPTKIEIREGVSLELWAQAFTEMASRA